MTPADLALHLKAKPTGSGWRARCPAHDDRTASLSIGEGKDGRLLLTCHAGCSFDQILQAAGVEPKANGADQGKPHIVAQYDYHDIRGNVVFQVVRMHPKDFRQRRPDGNGGWVWKMAGVERVPYRLPELLNATEVYICEGEKDCDNLVRLGLVATTNPGGASKWPEGFGRWFDGRHAIIVPDADLAGRQHALDVARKLKGHASSIRILELPGLPPKGDASDWLSAGGTVGDLEDLAHATPSWVEDEHDTFDQADDEPTAQTSRSSLYTLLRDLRPNLRSNEIIKNLLPRRALGEVHADAGGGKTAIIVDALLHVAGGIEYRHRRTEQQPVVYVSLEGHGGIENRIIAAAAEIGVSDGPFALVKSSDNFRDEEAAKKAARIAAELLQQFGGDNPIIAIDTYTAALGSDGSDCDPKDVSAFIQNIQRHLLPSCTVIVLHHFGKDSSRGGRGWSGLRAALDFELEIDQDGDLRTMRVTKARDGSDQQPACCYRLAGRELGLNEYNEPVTAVVVEHLADEDAAKRGKRTSPKTRSSLNVMWEMIKDRERSFPLPDQPGLRCVLFSDWEKACIAPGAICNCKLEKDRRKKFNAAKTELEEAHAIIVDSGRVYPTPKHEGTERDDEGD